MKRFAALAAILLAAASFCLPASALTPEIRDIDITLTLLPDGTASIHERWDVCAADGTEWYLVRGNLGDIEVGDLAVSDESGRSYVNEGSWDTDRSLAQKAGRCGILDRGDGVELCWGIGSRGDHVFDVSYTMSRSVKSLNDYDMLHLQTVSPGLSSPPRHVRVTVRALEHQLDTANTRAWGFGFNGRVDFRDGAVVYESTEPFVRNSSVIVLLRFEKGMFASPSVQRRDFSDALATAMEGADFGSPSSSGDDEAFAKFLVFFVLTLAAIIGISCYARYVNRKKILGIKPSEVAWCRDIPFGGNLEASAYTLSKLGMKSSTDNLAAALILRMIYGGKISVSKDADGNVELAFNSGDDSGNSGANGSASGNGSTSLGNGSGNGNASGNGSLSSGASGQAPSGNSGAAPDWASLGKAADQAADELRNMMLRASGSDHILQQKEFSRWAGKHASEVVAWTRRALVLGRNALRDNGMTAASGYSPAGQAEARKLAGLKKFLQDFTLMSEKDTVEVVLWQEYLVHGALFGIADKVAEQLKDISPETFSEVMDYDYLTMHQILFQTRLLSAAITNSKAALAAAEASRSAGGFGGNTSFGGGGGFSGGGFGGGSR